MSRPAREWTEEEEDLLLDAEELVEEGNIERYESVGRAMKKYLEALCIYEALKHPKGIVDVHYEMAGLYSQQGEFESAIKHFQTAMELAKQHNQYLVQAIIFNGLASIHKSKGEYAAAIETFEAVLRIDPEDLQAHYNVMLSYRGIGDRERAAAELTLYERFKADESAQAITGPFRRASPEDNNERQNIHEHRHNETS